MKSEELNKALWGFTIVRRLEFSWDLRSACTLLLDLTTDSENGEVVIVEFFDVASLSLTDFGGGLTQIARSLEPLPAFSISRR